MKPVKHSTKLALGLLALHHQRVQTGATVTYPPITTAAVRLWRHTGVCPRCHHRAITCGRCGKCGFRPEQ